MKRILVTAAAVIVCSAIYTIMMCAPFDEPISTKTVVKYIVTGAIIGVVVSLVSTWRSDKA